MRASGAARATARPARRTSVYSTLSASCSNLRPAPAAAASQSRRGARRIIPGRLSRAPIIGLSRRAARLLQRKSPAAVNGVCVYIYVSTRGGLTRPDT